jgi:hypothetical protein
MTSDTLLDTSRLEQFLGAAYTNVIRYPIAEAFQECFRKDEPTVAKLAQGKGG